MLLPIEHVYYKVLSVIAHIRQVLQTINATAFLHQVTYSRDQVVKATAMMDWSSGLDSSLTVVTPFAGWESSWAVLKHRGEPTDFSSSLEVTGHGHTGGASLNFQHRDLKTDAQLTITTPLTGWEQVRETSCRLLSALVTYLEENLLFIEYLNCIPFSAGTAYH